MTYANQYMRLKAQSVNTATPGEQIVMLFDRAVLKLTMAIQAIESKDVQAAHNAIIGVQNIYLFLCDSLNMNIAVSGDLYALYQYAYDELTTANFKKDAEIVRRILKMTREFRDTWSEAERATRMARAAK